MPTPTTIEKLYAALIKLLRDYSDNETAKQQALTDGDLDRFETLQAANAQVFKRIAEMAERLKEETGHLPPDKLSADQRDRLHKLNLLMQKAARAANKANQENQEIVAAIMDEINHQRQHIRRGRKAMVGYRKDQQSNDPPTILSGDI